MLNYKNNNLVDVKKITLFSVFLLVLSSCANKIPLNSFEQEVPKIAPIYSNIDHWAAHPEKSDYLDLKPKKSFKRYAMFRLYRCLLCLSNFIF